MKIKKAVADPVFVKKIQEDLGFSIPKYIAEILALRSFKDEHELLDFLLIEKKLQNPFLLPDMEKSCLRIIEAIKNQEEITICGDYDVDGTLATTILLRFLRKVGAKVSYFIPHRTLDGYGISDQTMINLKEKHNTKVVISVDTGTTAFDAANKAKELNMDLIVTDHHNLHQDGLPDVFALINAKRPECKNPDFQMLAGSGIAFYFIRALNLTFEKLNLRSKIDEDDYMVLAMMASIADVVPLLKDNRVIVKYGLEHLPYSKIEGVEALFQELSIDQLHPSARDIAFRFAPVINAAGRLGHAGQALDLFIETNKLQAAVKAQDLIKVNKQRQKISEALNKQVLEIGEKIVKESNPPVLVVAGEFHVGVIGIAAAKLVNAHHRPAIVIGFDETGYGKASCRTIEGMNVKKALDATRDHHLGGGGHDMAAGFSINKDQLEGFTEAVIKYFKENSNKEERTLIIESEFDCDEISEDGIKIIEMLEPFGKDNNAPMVKINNLKVSEQRTVRGGHLMFIFENELRGMLFNPTEKQKENSLHMFDAIGEISAQKGVMRIVINKILEKS